MLARIRVRVPDRPGSLGRVASAIGTASGDIAAVDVLQSEAGQALDDLVVRVRDAAHLQRVLDALLRVPGIGIDGVHSPEPPAAGSADLQLVAQMLARPARALQTLVDGAPAASRCTPASCGASPSSRRWWAPASRWPPPPERPRGRTPPAGAARPR